MATVLQIVTLTSQLFNSSSLLQLEYQVPQVTFDTTTQLYNSGVLSLGQGSQVGIADYISGTFTGSYFLFQSGTAIQFGLIDISSSSYSSFSSSLYWAGNMNQLGMVSIAIPEAHSHVQISFDNPSNSLEGGNTVEWDIFPNTPIVVAPPGRDRDLTRYHKAYSFTRPQPVRIRLIRR